MSPPPPSLAPRRSLRRGGGGGPGEKYRCAQGGRKEAKNLKRKKGRSPFANLASKGSQSFFFARRRKGGRKGVSHFHKRLVTSELVLPVNERNPLLLSSRMKRRRRVVVQWKHGGIEAWRTTEQSRDPPPPSCQLFSSRRKPHCRAGERSGGPGSVRLSREEWKEGGVRHNNAKEALSLPLLPISPFPALSSPPPSKRALRRPKVESTYLPTCAPVRPLACARKACSSAREKMGEREGGRCLLWA